MIRGAAVLLLALAPRARAQAPPAPPVIGEVSARVDTANSAVISWTTDQIADSEADYGLSAAYSNSASLNSPPAVKHSIVLSGLAEAALYHYRVKSRSSAGILAVSDDFTFTTAPPSAAEVAPPAAAGGAQAAPLVLIMTPPASALLSGAVTVSANATAGAGVASVQFLLDGRDLAPPLTAAPYTFSWNTALVADGEHALAAVVRDAAGGAATSPIVRVIVDNTPPGISEVSAAAVGPDGAVIVWTTSEPADSHVEYGMTADYGQATALSAFRTVKRGVALTGLASEALYHYRVKSRDAAGLLAVSEDYLFATAETPAAASSAAAPGVAAADPDAAAAKAPQKFLTPALADGINDKAVFGPEAREVTIVDLRGRRVYHEDSNGPPIVWNCRDASGRLVPSGVYIAIIVTRGSKRLYQSLIVAK